MSHFIGLVFKHKDDDLDTILEPFDEQNEDYYDFCDCTDEVKELYDKMPEDCPDSGKYIKTEEMTDTVNKVWNESADEPVEESESALFKPYNKKEFPTPMDIAKDKGYAVWGYGEDARFFRVWESDYKYEPCKRKYPTLDALAEHYFCYKKVNGKYGYRHNPNARYDWYSEDGGRWGGYLINKEGKNTAEELLTEIDWEKQEVPFCFVGADGVWYERGKMGWWCSVADEKNKGDWGAEFKGYVQTLMKQAEEFKWEIEVIAVDFHI